MADRPGERSTRRPGRSGDIVTRNGRVAEKRFCTFWFKRSAWDEKPNSGFGTCGRPLPVKLLQRLRIL
jgi:hypothetical protein